MTLKEEFVSPEWQAAWFQMTASGLSAAVKKIPASQLDARGPSGRTLMHVAANLSDEMAVACVLDQIMKLATVPKVQVLNGCDYEGNTPLHVAALARAVEPMALLLALGADPHIVNNNGVSAAQEYTRSTFVHRISPGQDVDHFAVVGLGDDFATLERESVGGAGFLMRYWCLNSHQFLSNGDSKAAVYVTLTAMASPGRGGGGGGGGGGGARPRVPPEIAAFILSFIHRSELGSACGVGAAAAAQQQQQQQHPIEHIAASTKHFFADALWGTADVLALVGAEAYDNGYTTPAFDEDGSEDEGGFWKSSVVADSSKARAWEPLLATTQDAALDKAAPAAPAKAEAPGDAEAAAADNNLPAFFVTSVAADKAARAPRKGIPMAARLPWPSLAEAVLPKPQAVRTNYVELWDILSV